MSQHDSGRVIQSVQTALNIVDHIRESDGSTVTELAERTGLTPGSVHTHLATLERAGYVVQNGRKYRLGPQFLTLGEHFRNHSELYQASKSRIEELAEGTGECAHLIIEHDGKLFALYERFGSEAVGVELHDRKREQPLNHLHCTAAGKSILAHLPDERIREIVDERGLPENTPKTITDRGELLEELERVRERGFAVADEEQMQGIRAVGAPVTDGEEVAGAIALSGPASRLQGEQFRSEFPELVIQAANICEVNLQTAEVEEEYIS